MSAIQAIPFATDAAAARAAASARPSDQVAAIGSAYSVVSNDHGYRVIRHLDGGVAQFYGDDSSEDFLNHYDGDECPGDDHDPLADGDQADRAGEWAEDAREFDIVPDSIRIARKAKIEWESPETAPRGEPVLVKGTLADGTPFAALAISTQVAGPTASWAEPSGRRISAPGVTITGWHPYA